MSIWVALLLIVVGLALFSYGRGTRFRDFRGNFGKSLFGGVTQTYSETSAPPAQPVQTPSNEERFIKWAGLVIALAGVVVGIAKLVTG